MFFGAGIHFHLITRPALDPDSEGSALGFRGGILRVFQAFSLVCLFLYLPDSWFEEGKAPSLTGGCLGFTVPWGGRPVRGWQGLSPATFAVGPPCSWRGLGE